MKAWAWAAALASLPLLAQCARRTDSTQDQDGPQSGYLPQHNVDPDDIPSWRVRWQSSYEANEVFYAKPLVYTPPTWHDEGIITASNQNWLRLTDARDGKLIRSRHLAPPFLSTDARCGDIPGTVGITGTPYIDTNTNIMYFWSKQYKNKASGGGTTNAVYKFYAVNLPTFTDVQGFPITIDGVSAVNDPSRYFVSGIALQRPGMTVIGDQVVTGFGSHCDFFNYTGYLVTINKKTGAVNNLWATMAAPGGPDTGGGGAIWQSGQAMAIDGNRFYFTTGNGFGGPGELTTQPRNGKIPISTLQQAIASFRVDPTTGRLTPSDYFVPHDFEALNRIDSDIGSSGVTLLDRNAFKKNGVPRLALAGGKRGNVFVMNADNLGGFKNGPGGQDGVLQVIKAPKGLYGGASSYPVEGPYVYLPSPKAPITVFKWDSGAGNFTQVAESPGELGGRGGAVITSLDGKPGTGVVWVSDLNRGLVAFKAVPVNGKLVEIPLPKTLPVTKYQRPTFGNARVYTVSGNTLIAVGRPG